MSEAQSFEALMSQLEAVVDRLESKDLSLEDAIAAYQSGVELAKQGHARLAEAERKIEVVTKGGTRDADLSKILDEEP